jgi:hypothetical protein
MILSQLIKFSRALVEDKETVEKTKRFFVSFPKELALKMGKMSYSRKL